MGLGEAGGRAAVHEGLEMTEEPLPALPSERADLDRPKSSIRGMSNGADEAFLVQAYQRLNERCQGYGEDREQVVARQGWSIVFMQERQDLDLQWPQIHFAPGISDCASKLSIHPDLINGRERRVEWRRREHPALR